jgi:2-hydroxychromene-2-carboxylate isomerase
MREIDFWFDFLSPYAFLAWRRAPTFLSGARLRPRPVLLGALLGHFGQLGPAEIAPKRIFTIRDTLRRAADAGIPMTWPERHPFKPILAARVALAADCAFPVIDALFDAAWIHGEDLEDPAVVVTALNRAGLDGTLVDRARSMSDRLRSETTAAIARGVFGVPMFDVGGELFFGDDQLPRIAAVLSGHDRLDVDLARRIEARPPGVVRAS